MKLSAPKYITWLIAVIVGVVGLLMHFGVLSLGGVSATVMIAIGFVVLAVATAVKGL